MKLHFQVWEGVLLLRFLRRTEAMYADRRACIKSRFEAVLKVPVFATNQNLHKFVCANFQREK